MWRIAGMGKQVDLWKKTLVQVNEEEARLAGQTPYDLWDFGGYNSITTEPVPPMGDTTTLMRWHWEGSHFSQEVAWLILDKIFGYTDSGRKMPNDFGKLINTRNIDRHIESINQAGMAYRREHPTDIAELMETKREIELLYSKTE